MTSQRPETAKTHRTRTYLVNSRSCSEFFDPDEERECALSGEPLLRRLGFMDWMDTGSSRLTRASGVYSSMLCGHHVPRERENPDTERIERKDRIRERGDR